MLKQLRLKIIAIELVSFLAVIGLIVFVINTVSRQQVNKTAHEILLMLSRNNGIVFEDDHANGKDSNSIVVRNEYNLGFGEDINIETSYSMRYFSIDINEDGTIEDYDLKHIAAISENDIDGYASLALENKEKEDTIGYYRFMKVENDNTTRIYFLDCYSRYMFVNYLMELSLKVGIACMVLVSIIVYIFSEIAIRPIKENLRRQKQFFADASHELKTPVAAISANVDVLELVSGPSETTEKIKRQTNQLGKLINEMLLLSKLEDEPYSKEEERDILLSEKLNQQVDDMEARVLNEGKSIEKNIQENVVYKGVEKDIYRLCSILLDNAVKYCDESGKIVVSLKSDKKSRVIRVHNTCQRINENELQHLFDRFYRGDEARNRDSGSYGIGLSIARAIVEKHKGKINVLNEGDGVTFEVYLI